MTFGMLAIPSSTAHDPPWTIPTFAYTAVTPSTVGIGQTTTIVMWLDKYPPTAGGEGGDRWNNITISVTKPNGDVTTLGPFTSGPVGSTWTNFTPDQTGNYTIVANFGGQTLTNGSGTPNAMGVIYVGDYYQPSTSQPITLQVQQDPVAQWEETPVTTDYWTRPITDINRGWSSITSNWLGGSWLVGNVQMAGTAPGSAHVLWTKPIVMGGIADEQWFAQPYGTNDYEFPWSWSGPIIMNGIAYYNTPMYPKYGYYAMDLKTGEQIWYKNGTDNGLNGLYSTAQWQGLGGAGVYSGQNFPRLSFGQLQYWYGVNGQGILSYLWETDGTTWYMIDANTGNWIETLVNVPSGTAVTDQDGSLLRYSYSAQTGRFLCWNSTQAIGPPSPTGTGQQQWKPRVGATIDAVNDSTWLEWGPNSQIPADWLQRYSYSMNVSGPTGLPSLSRVLQDDNRVPKEILFSTFNSASSTFRVALVKIEEHAVPMSPNPDKSATQNYDLGYRITLEWNKTYTNPAGGNLTMSLGGASYNDRVWVVNSKETMQHWGFSLDTGDLIWGPTDPQPAFDMYGMSGTVANGQLYSCGLGGVLYDYDIKTGNVVWTYNATDVGSESPYGNFPLTISAIADGKVYLTSGEHSPTRPMWRGSYLRCVNATDGNEIWKLLDFNMVLGVADGCILTGNMYDTQFYAIGKGPSATTVQAPLNSVKVGDNMVIQGMVTDQSPGAKKLAGTMGYANGVPAIADSDMQPWMEYLYEQQSMPTDAKGVDVSLDAVDPNGNFVHIGDATSDMNGAFSYVWTPPDIPGKYNIVARFAGSESYGSSSAQTTVDISQAPSTTSSTQTTVQESPMLTYVLAAVIALIVIVIAIGVLLLRRK